MSLLGQLLDAIDDFEKCAIQLARIPDDDPECKYALDLAIRARRRVHDLRDAARKLGPL